MDWKNSLIDLIESMNVIHLKVTGKNHVKFKDNQFTDNISFDGAIFIDNFNTVTISEKNSFIRN